MHGKLPHRYLIECNPQAQQTSSSNIDHHTSPDLPVVSTHALHSSFLGVCAGYPFATEPSPNHRHRAQPFAHTNRAWTLAISPQCQHNPETAMSQCFSDLLVVHYLRSTICAQHDVIHNKATMDNSTMLLMQPA